MQSARADSALVTGAISNRSGQSLPGCTVFVVSGNYRTAPGITGTLGTFEIEVSVETNSPYYLEIYWGQELMYRKRLYREPFGGPLWGTRNGNLAIPHISLGLAVPAA
jgi:hypothetical protein